MNKDKLNTEETTIDYFQDIKTKARQYVEQRLLLFRLQTTEKISKIAATIITTILIAATGLFLLVFISITAALWIGESLGSNVAGFGIVTGFYLLVFLFVMFILKKILQNSFINKLIRLLHKKD
jgi:hypothetical protein